MAEAERIKQCPHCGSIDLIEITIPSGPHYGRLNCDECGRWLAWLPAPMTADRAAAFVMPFGKHKGARLDDVPTDYLRWLWASWAGRGSIRGMARVILESRGAIDHARYRNAPDAAHPRHD